MEACSRAFVDADVGLGSGASGRWRWFLAVTLRWDPSTVVGARICRIAGARVRGLRSGSPVRCRFVLELACCSLIASCGKYRGIGLGCG